MITFEEGVELGARYHAAIRRVAAANCKNELQSAIRDAHAVCLLMIEATKDSPIASGKKAYASGIAARDVLEKTARDFGFSIVPETAH